MALQIVYSRLRGSVPHRSWEWTPEPACLQEPGLSRPLAVNPSGLHPSCERTELSPRLELGVDQGGKSASARPSSAVIGDTGHGSACLA